MLFHFIHLEIILYQLQVIQHLRSVSSLETQEQIIILNNYDKWWEFCNRHSCSGSLSVHCFQIELECGMLDLVQGEEPSEQGQEPITNSTLM